MRIVKLIAPTLDSAIDLKKGVFGPHTDWIVAISEASTNWIFEIECRAKDRETVELMHDSLKPMNRKQ